MATWPGGSEATIGGHLDNGRRSVIAIPPHATSRAEADAKSATESRPRER
jgi:hypothetical protein